MAENEVYYPETIEDQPLPGTGQEAVPVTQQGSNPMGQEVIRPTAEIPKHFPEKIIAHETISKALDTRTRKIKAEFTFGKSGALKIGEYEFGVSGEIAFTPNGMAARNVNGDYTVAIDVATGDAIFKGALQAGSLIAGDSKVVIEGSPSGGRMVFFDSNLIPSILLGYV